MKYQQYRQWANVDDLSPKGINLRHGLIVLSALSIVILAMMIKFIDVL